MTTRMMSALMVLLVTGLQASADPPQYALQYLGDATLITGMNEGGVVVGWTVTGQLRGFVAGPYHPYELLPLPSGYTSSWAKDINDAGVIVGSAGAAVSPEIGDGVMWIPNESGGYDIEFLGHLPGHTGSVGTAINNRGDIVGTSIFNNSGFGPAVWFNAPGGILDITALDGPTNPQDVNDNGLVVGFGFRLFDLDTLQSKPLPAGTLGGTAVMATNNNGDLAGYAIPSCQCTRFAVRYTEQFGWQQIGATANPSAQVSAWGINDHSDTVGDMLAPAVYFDQHGLLSLQSLLAPEFGNWGFFTAQGEHINNGGQIAAMATNSSSFITGAVLLTPLGQMIIPGDVNGDATVNLDDLCAWLAEPIDLNDDGVVDEADEQWLLERLAQLGFVVADCNDNGVGDHCDITGGASQDCDTNDIPDECQADCNSDGVPNACEPDCNGNAVADPCDIADFTSLDCNENGVPDECDQGGLAEIANLFDPPLELIENDTLLDDLLVTDVGIIEDVDFTIDIDYRIGDLTVLLSHGDTTITLIDRPGHPEVFLGNGQLGYDIVLDDEGTGGAIEDQGNFGPPFEPITSPPSYTPNEALSAFDGMQSAGVWTVHIITSPNYSPAGTFTAWGLNITLAAVPVGPCDCNGNGIPDEQDIADGTSPDDNGNGVPDECENKRGDMDGDGLVGAADLALLLGSWGPCEGCPGDLNDDQMVDAADLAILLGEWDS